MEVDFRETEGIVMPELILYRIVKSIFSLVKTDFTERGEMDSMLFHYFGKDSFEGEEMEWETFNYFEQSKELFLRKEIQVNLGYNLSVSEIPNIHIMLPSESGKPLGIGADENYVGYNDGFENQPVAVFSEMFSATYNLIITSPNSLEVILIYNLLRAAMISTNYHLELAGLRLPRISGQDIQMQSDLTPTHIFHRGLGISFDYEIIVPDVLRKRIVKGMEITGIKKAKE